MAIVTIRCQNPTDDFDVMNALVQAHNEAVFDPMASILIERLTQAWFQKMNPTTYHRVDPGTYVGSGLIAMPPNQS